MLFAFCHIPSLKLWIRLNGVDLMDNKERKDALENMDEFNKKYNHYVSEKDETQIVPVPQIKKTEHNTSPIEDISSYSDDALRDEDDYSDTADNSEIKNGNFFTKNKYRNSKIIALILVIALLLSAGGVALWLYLTTKSDGYGDDGIDYNKIDKDYLVDDDTEFNVMGDIDADSLNAFLYQWANNGGDKMSNKNIINVLLCGVDSEYNLCDSQILISIDKKNEKITMVSFLRDSWTYIKMPNEDGTYYDTYEKINAAYHGGPKTLLETIENNYKIKIDQYIAVDFKSFPKVIDAIGGVTVDVQDYEADYIRNTSSQTDFPYGTATLNGTQALIYSRIRHCDDDSDLSRTRRQRSVIKSLINQAKNATNGQLVNAYKQITDYLRTGYTQKEVLSLIATAYAHNWMDFEITEYIMPNEDYVERIGGMINDSTWAWTVDYPLCAQRLQKILYGKTNIVLSEDRVSPLDSVSNRRDTTTDSSSDSSSSSYDSDYSSNDYNRSDNNDNYDEPNATEPEPITEAPTSSAEEPATEAPTAEEDPEKPADADEGRGFLFRGQDN